jgi:hypothetical protein
MNDRSTLTWDASTFVTSKGTLLESRASCQMKFYSTSKLCQYMKPELLCALQRIEGTVLLLFTLSSVTYSCKYSHVTCALKIIISFFWRRSMEWVVPNCIWMRQDTCRVSSVYVSADTKANILSFVVVEDMYEITYELQERFTVHFHLIS